MNYNVDEKGYYGDFGGAFIPEMLYPNVAELREKYLKISCSKNNVSITSIQSGTIEPPHIIKESILFSIKTIVNRLTSIHWKKDHCW